MDCVLGKRRSTLNFISLFFVDSTGSSCSLCRYKNVSPLDQEDGLGSQLPEFDPRDPQHGRGEPYI